MLLGFFMWDQKNIYNSNELWPESRDMTLGGWMGFIVRAYQITERVGIFPAEQFCDFLGVNEKKKLG